jgi:hypothetical protein
MLRDDARGYRTPISAIGSPESEPDQQTVELARIEQGAETMLRARRDDAEGTGRVRLRLHCRFGKIVWPIDVAVDVRSAARLLVRGRRTVCGLSNA